MSRTIGYAITLLLVLTTLSLADERPEYKISVVCINQQNCTIPELEEVFMEAYGRIGIRPNFIYLPLLRGLDEVNTGTLDACALRTETAFQGYANLRPLPVPMIRQDIVAVTMRHEMKIESWDDLADLTIGVQRGNIIALREVEKRGYPKYEYNSQPGAFKMLDEGRLDVILMGSGMAQNSAEQLGMQSTNISPPLSQAYYYHVVNRKHENLIPKLSKALLDMRGDGSMKRLMGKYAWMYPDLPTTP